MPTEPDKNTMPAFPVPALFAPGAANAPCVPLVFNVDARYLPYLGVTLQSLIEAASAKHNYDLIVLQTGLSREQKELLSEQVANLSNFSLRFFDMTALVARFGVGAWYSYPLSAAAYFRLFIPLIMQRYSKVIYLDADLLIRADPAALMNVELGSDLLAGVRDFGDRHLLEGSFERDGTRIAKRDYMRDELGISDPAAYVNSGVLVFNVTALNEADVLPAFISRAGRGCLQHDQDVLNSVCRGRIRYLPEEWNAQWHVLFRPAASSMPQAQVEEILRRANIIHYVVVRPHETPPNEFSRPWLDLAAKVPFAACLG